MFTNIKYGLQDQRLKESVQQNQFQNWFMFPGSCSDSSVDEFISTPASTPSRTLTAQSIRLQFPYDHNLSFASLTTASSSMEDYVMLQNPASTRTPVTLRQKDSWPSVPMSSSLPNIYEPSTDLCAIQFMGQDMSTDIEYPVKDSFVDLGLDSNAHRILMTSMDAGFNFDFSPPNHGIPSLTPEPEPYTPTSTPNSSLRGDFVNPGQITQGPFTPDSISSGSIASIGIDCQEGSIDNTPSRMSCWQRPQSHTLPTSTALHRVQSEPLIRATKKSHRSSLSRSRMGRRTLQEPTLLPPNVSHARSAKKTCPFPGCTKKFQRQEHLKRHERAHTGADQIPCEFCKKPFSRRDNYKQHLKLHCDPKEKSKRTKYYPTALAAYESMTRKSRKSMEKLSVADDGLDEEFNDADYLDDESFTAEHVKIKSRRGRTARV